MARLQDTLIKTTAIKLAIPERIVEAVVNHQFASTTAAMDGSNRTVEISGFGKFKFSLIKANKRLERLEKRVETLEEQLANPETLKKSEEWTKSNLNVTKRLIKQLKPIVDEFQADIRGVEK